MGLFSIDLSLIKKSPQELALLQFQRSAPPEDQGAISYLIKNSERGVLPSTAQITVILKEFRTIRKAEQAMELVKMTQQREQEILARLAAKEAQVTAEEAQLTAARQASADAQAHLIKIHSGGETAPDAAAPSVAQDAGFDMDKDALPETTAIVCAGSARAAVETRAAQRDESDSPPAAVAARALDAPGREPAAPEDPALALQARAARTERAEAVAAELREQLNARDQADAARSASRQAQRVEVEAQAEDEGRRRKTPAAALVTCEQNAKTVVTAGTEKVLEALKAKNDIPSLKRAESTLKNSGEKLTVAAKVADIAQDEKTKAFIAQGAHDIPRADETNTLFSVSFFAKHKKETTGPHKCYREQTLKVCVTDASSTWLPNPSPQRKVLYQEETKANVAAAPSHLVAAREAFDKLCADLLAEDG